MLLSATSALAAGGTLDPTFGSNGVVTTKFHDRPSSTWDVVLQADGKIVTLGTSNQSVDNHKKIITRYNSNGTLDIPLAPMEAHFIEVESFSGSKIALQPDGKLIVGGLTAGSLRLSAITATARGIPHLAQMGWRIFVSGRGGRNPSPMLRSNPMARSLLLATTRWGNPISPTSLIARFNSNGTPDETFVANGFQIIDDIFPK